MKINIINQVILLLINFYQKYISPYKGFSCAFRIRTNECSCSNYGIKVFKKYNFFIAYKLLKRRFIDCSWANKSLKKQKIIYKNRVNHLYLKKQMGVVDCDCLSSFIPDSCDFSDINNKNSNFRCFSSLIDYAPCDCGYGNKDNNKRYHKNDKKYNENK